jgi:aspartyl-tRNA(Asn)/glutamyl-tRNA(Gln) amidotransferase subunit C
MVVADRFQRSNKPVYANIAPLVDQAENCAESCVGLQPQNGERMSLDTDDIKAIAKLARLNIDEADVPSYATNLSNILDLVEQMNSVDTEGVVPMSHPLDVDQRLREDKVTETDQRDEFQKGAPATQDGLYLVPKVIE